MHAEVGNWLVIRSHSLDVPVRLGRIVEVNHPDGGPPYVVRWGDEDRTSVVFPGPDAVVMDHPPTTAASRQPG
jgi:Domain of unknown function (DUF1918)